MPYVANPPYQPRYHAGPAARQQANAPYLLNYLITNSLRLPVLVPPLRLQARQGLSVLPLMTAAAAHMPTREPAHLRHPPSGTHRRRQGRAQWRPSRKVPAVWRGGQLLAGRVEAENGPPPAPRVLARDSWLGGLPDGVGASSAPKLPKNSKQPPTTRAGRTSIKPLNALASRCKVEGWMWFLSC